MQDALQNKLNIKTTSLCTLFPADKQAQEDRAHLTNDLLNCFAKETRYPAYCCTYHPFATRKNIKYLGMQGL